MTYAIVYSSKTGNTQALANAIRAALPGENCLYIGGPDPKASQADLLFVGSWTDKGSCTREVADFLAALSGRRVALFGTAGFGGSREYFDGVANRFEGCLLQGNQVVGRYFCQGRMPQAVRERYEGLLRQNPGDSKALAMVENFDRALAHPNEADLAGAREFARRIWKEQ